MKKVLILSMLVGTTLIQAADDLTEEEMAQFAALEEEAALQEAAAESALQQALAESRQRSVEQIDDQELEDVLTLSAQQAVLYEQEREAADESRQLYDFHQHLDRLMREQEEEQEKKRRPVAQAPAPQQHVYKKLSPGEAEYIKNLLLAVYPQNKVLPQQDTYHPNFTGFKLTDAQETILRNYLQQISDEDFDALSALADLKKTTIEKILALYLLTFRSGISVLDSEGESSVGHVIAFYIATHPRRVQTPDSMQRITEDQIHTLINIVRECPDQADLAQISITRQQQSPQSTTPYYTFSAIVDRIKRWWYGE